MVALSVSTVICNLAMMLAVGAAQATESVPAQAVDEPGSVVRFLDPEASVAERVVMVLHGAGSDPVQIMRIFDGMKPTVGSDASSAAATLPRKSVVLVAPQGQISLGTGRGFLWYSRRGSGPTDAHTHQEMLDAADRVARLLARVAGTAEKRPVVVGFSQGGLITLALALHHPESVSLAIPISGWLPDSLMPLAGPPKGAPRIVALHGTKDERVPFASTEHTITQLQERGWSAEMKSYDGVGHWMSSAMRQDLYTLVREAP